MIVLSLAICGCGEVVVRANHTYNIEITQRLEDYAMVRFTLNETGERNDVNNGPTTGNFGGLATMVKVKYGVPFTQSITDGGKRYGIFSGVIDKTGMPSFKFEYSYKYR